MLSPKPSSSSSQAAPLPKPLTTSRSTHVSPERDRTSHSLASRLGSAPGGCQSVVCSKRCGGPQPVTSPAYCMPEPMSNENVPACSSTSVGCSQLSRAASRMWSRNGSP